MRHTVSCLLVVALAAAQSPPEYDLLIRGGRVIDPANSLDAIQDVAVRGTRIARVAT